MRDLLIEFLDNLREYTRESGNNLANDERESHEFVDIFLSSKNYVKTPVSTRLTGKDLIGKKVIITEEDRESFGTGTVCKVTNFCSEYRRYTCNYGVSGLLYYYDEFEVI